MALYDNLIIVKNFFYITLVHNKGAAFSILDGNRMILIFISLLALFLIYNFYIKNDMKNRLESITYGILVGGILGNLLDRIFYGYVIDYFNFKIFGYNFPVFNIADICIVISVILMTIVFIRGEVCKVSK